jgi:hypothetical protein
MNTNSPIDPLYWFKSQPPNLHPFFAHSEEGEMIAVDRLHKWRFVSQDKQDGMFLCEIVGGNSCGLRFILPEVAIAAAERVD